MPSSTSNLALRTLALVLTCAGCSEPPRTYDDQIAASRAEKDAAFKSTSDSPIPAGQRADFQGLAYFDVDPAFRVPAALAETPMSTQVIEMDTTDGNRERMRVIGKLEFTLAGERRSLTAFVPERAQTAERLFVPFRDATNRGETYGGGRYLDLQRSSTGLYDLDFNRAYNPFCVYDAQYVCPLPPRENSLPLPIRAGEKMPRGKDEFGVRGSTFEVLPGGFAGSMFAARSTRNSELARPNLEPRTSNLEL
jgi:hypothetical protein